ncbi:PLP-dependent aminotransferase family protein [Brucella oryzae]|uniref:GntR family transcriptional regulator n=1 Tax=Brucella oryzae TaxID=335286 RepID=A0A2S7J3N3_9HYPH|nr:PLP-dependent aminotransferase family protein [Brucella oryzae]MBR7654203.1 PLP-dependent aminotransferase family protein [Brucella oryzae]PQA74845.1 GntR family transcriptional regulator [Brucella oryzae]
MPISNTLPEFGIDRASDVSLTAQLVEQIRQAVLTGRLKPDARLPSTRALSLELGLSRTTVLAAFDQLISEGYLEGRQGSGTHIAAELPDTSLTVGQPPLHAITQSQSNRKETKPFRLGVFDSDNFPHNQWGKLLGRIWRVPSYALLNNEDAFGFHPLRISLARHLHEWRGMMVSPEQIIITGGSADALSLIREALFAPGDRLWMEEPGYPPARKILGTNGLDIVAVPVDSGGLDVSVGRDKAIDARGAFVTPARHHPTGVTMTLGRRLELIAWAKEHDAFIVEDDYDSEHRYIGQPLPALMSLDPERILYIGSFSKVFSPLLRLGFLIVPSHMVDQFRALRQTLFPAPSPLAQPALASFIETGAFAQHIRRMRRIHASRRRRLITALAPGEPKLFRIEAPPAGLSLLLALPDGQADTRLATILAETGIEVQSLSSLYTKLAPRQGLILGFSGFDETALENSATALIKTLEQSN